MKIDFSKFKKIGAGWFDRDRSSQSFKPWRDWKIIVVIFISLEIIFIGLHYFSYQWLIYQREKNLSGNSSDPAEIKEKKLLTETYNYLTETERLFEEIKNNRPKLVDPSL